MNTGTPDEKAEVALLSLLAVTNTERIEQGPLLNCIDSFIYNLKEGLINEGANFIYNEVLAGASDETKNAFESMDPGTTINSYVLTKSIYIYGLGSKRNDPIPSFFKLTTRECIEELRQDPNLNFDVTPQAPTPASILKESKG